MYRSFVGNKTKRAKLMILGKRSRTLPFSNQQKIRILWAPQIESQSMIADRSYAPMRSHFICKEKFVKQMRERTKYKPNKITVRSVFKWFFFVMLLYFFFFLYSQIRLKFLKIIVAVLFNCSQAIKSNIVQIS